MTFMQFLSILRGRWFLALSVLLLTVAAALVVSLLLPKKYTASASIVADLKPDPVSGLAYPGLGTPQFMATQVDVLKSARVLQRVVRNLKLTENSDLRQQWMEATGGEGRFEGWIAESLRRAADIKPSLESNVITVSFTAPDPGFSAAAANAFVQAYLEVTLDLKVDPAKQVAKFFEVQSKEAREALEKAQSRLSAYQKEKGVVISEERYDVESARLNELSTQLVMLQALATESGSRQSQAEGEGAERLHEVLNNPLIASLKGDLSRAEARFQEMTSRLGDNHPQVVEAKANIASLRTRLNAETRRVTGSVGVTATINRQRENQVRAALEAQRAKVQQLKLLRDEGGVLLRDVESARRSYDAVLARLNQTSLESQTRQSNIYVLAEASPPSKPSSPNVPLNAALSIVLGALLAAGSVLALEMQDRRLRALDDVSTSLGLPLIGVLPKPGQRARLSNRSLPLLRQHMAGSRRST